MKHALRDLLTSKTDCLQRLRDTADAFIALQATWDFSDLEHLLKVRTQILGKLQWLDREIAEWTTSGSGIPRVAQDELKDLAQRMDVLASLVLDREKKILEVVESRKAELLQEKWQGEKARTVLGKFKSKVRPDSGEGLDQTL